MALGDLIRDLTDEDVAAEALLACGDLTLRLRVDAVAPRFGESPGDYAAGAVRRFSSAAGDEDWLALMNRIERASDPGHACIRHMIEWALQEDLKPAPEGTSQHVCACGGGCH